MTAVGTNDGREGVMVAELPTPLVPAEVDLRGYQYMPLDVVRLMRSSSWRKIRRQPELGYWSLNLWASSWHEVPASSLPNDDDELADFARCDPKKWGRVRELVLAGWVKCSDGRLYHPVVAEKALEAWAKMSLQRKRTQAAREALKQKLSKRPAEAASTTDKATVAAPVTESFTASKGEEKRRTEQRREESSPAAASVGDTARAESAEAPQAAAADEGPRAAMANRELVDEAFRRWSVVANDLRIPDVGYLNSTRRSALAQRLAEIGGLDGWDLFLEKIRAAKFLLKPDGRPKFWVGLGKLLEPETFSKILEDRYVEHHERARDDERSTSAAIAGLREEIAR